MLNQCFKICGQFSQEEAKTLQAGLGRHLGQFYSYHLERSWFTTGLASMRLSMRSRGQPGGQKEPASHAGEVHPGRKGGHCPGWLLPAP